MRLVSAAAAAALLLALASCSTDADVAPATGTVVGEAAANGNDAVGADTAAADPVVVDPCAEAAGSCTYVGQADVDGDGVVNQIGVGTASGSPTIWVAVDGEVSTLSGPESGNSLAFTSADDLYFGAFEFSRASGSDIVLHTVPGGGNAEQFLVATWRDGALSWLPSPPRENNFSNVDQAVWLMQSSHGATTEYACKGSGVIGFETSYAPTREGTPQPKGDTRDIQRYTFEDGAWVDGGTENVPDPDGWNMNWKAEDDAFQCSDETLPAG